MPTKRAGQTSKGKNKWQKEHRNETAVAAGYAPTGGAAAVKRQDQQDEAEGDNHGNNKRDNKGKRKGVARQ